MFYDTLHDFYINFPSGWNGRSNDEICFKMTGVPNVHWQNEGFGECESLIEKQFLAYYTTFKAFMKLYFTIEIMKKTCNKCLMILGEKISYTNETNVHSALVQ